MKHDAVRSNVHRPVTAGRSLSIRWCRSRMVVSKREVLRLGPTETGRWSVPSTASGPSSEACLALALWRPLASDLDPKP